jgi:pimeloyl-ACP methyl ester carboxylesterase
MTATLFLVPAFGCDNRLFEHQISYLHKLINIIVHVPSQFSYAAMVDEVLRAAPEDFAILGTSMGGRLALEVALAAPGRVAGLCVIGAGAGPVADVAAGLKRSQRIRGGEQAQVIAEMAEKIAHLPGPHGAATRQAFIDMGMACDRETLARQSDALAGRVDRWPQVPEIACLTLCLWGEHDQFSPAADGLRLAHDVMEGGYTELPDCGHFPTLEYPDAATESIVAWLEDAGMV